VAEAAPVVPAAVEPELVSVLVPVEPPVVPPAPMEVPPPVLPVVPPRLEPVPVEAPALVLPVPVVLPVPAVLPIEPEVLPGLLLLVVSLGEVVVEGVVLEVLDEFEPAPVSSFLPQADRDKAAIRARAAQRATGDLIMGTP
jgi:hypothetical protein